MVSFLYPRKGQTQSSLPHSQTFKSLKKHMRQPHSAAEQMSLHTEQPYTHSGAADLDMYTASMHRWTLGQFHTSFPTVRRRLSRHQYSYTAFSHTPTIVSPLYPRGSLLWDCCSISTPRLDSFEREEEEDVMGDVGTTPCNTPKDRRLRRRSTVVVAKGRKVREEVADEEEGQARLRPVELVKSLNCAG